MTSPRPRAALALAFAGLLAARCASSKTPPPNGPGPDGGSGSPGSGGNGTGGGGPGSGGNTGGGGGNTGGGQGTTDAAVIQGDAATVVPGAPNCGLASPAFCETFDKPVGKGGRAGELDHRIWSGSRVQPQMNTTNGLATGIANGTIPACRSGLPTTVPPNQDTLICDPNNDLRNNHMLVTVAAQNYGQNGYRIRQPFDFAGRTGKIVFDAEGFIYSTLMGWVSLEITEDPVNAPSYSVGAPGQNNDEGGIVPRNAVEINFSNNCAGFAPPPVMGVRLVDVITDYKDSVTDPKTPTCVSTKKGSLNHFEVAISQRKLEIYATDASTDGSTFGQLHMLLSVDLNLPFSRGYVNISTHNHATLKYSGPGNSSIPRTDAWTARWDNVGFDGPVINNWREYEVDDALIPGKDAPNLPAGPVLSIGYVVPDAAMPPKALTIKGVDLANVTAARLSLSVWMDYGQGMPAQFTLRYRLNGKAFIDRKVTPGELYVLTNGHTLGQFSMIIDVPLGDLVSGDNVLEVNTVNVPRGYPPALSNIDLVLTTK
jgi:hypothetical protein